MDLTGSNLLNTEVSAVIISHQQQQGWFELENK